MTVWCTCRYPTRAIVEKNYYIEKMTYKMTGTAKLISFLIIGFIAGWIAEKVLNRNHGLFKNIIVGIIGSFIGGFLAGGLGIVAIGFIGNLVIASIGAIFFLWVYDQIRSR